MKICVTGGSGFIGTALTRALRSDGHDVVRLVRRAPSAADEAQWDPAHGTVDINALVGTDAVVNLAGAGVGDRRWNDAVKAELRSSRIDSTTTIATAIARLDPPPQVLLSGSAIGFYGDTGDRELDEESPRGAGFFPDLVSDWEAATAHAEAAGIRVAHLRTGIVLDGSGGTLGGTVRAFGVPVRLLLLFKSGLGGPLGSGKQWVSWISLADEVRAISFLLTADVRGPVDLTAPQPVRNRDWVHAIGRAVHRPAVLPAPGFALRAAVGEFAGEVLTGQRVLPSRLTAAGFGFDHPDIDTALAASL